MLKLNTYPIRNYPYSEYYLIRYQLFIGKLLNTKGIYYLNFYIKKKKLGFFGKDNPFFNSFNVNKIDNFNNSNHLHQHSSFNIDSDKPDKIKMFSKRVKSIRQLKNIEKELVRLSYKETVLRGLGNNITDIQDYILSKTHILVERTGMEYLKKSEELENRTWYSRVAKD